MDLVTRGFHHITLVARDAVRTTEFYRDILGLELKHRTPHFDDPETEQLVFDGGINFLVWRDMQPGRWGVGGIHHVALGVADQNVQLKWKRWLTDRGVSVSGPYDRGWFTSIYFTDPDGQVLEIATAGPGYELDEPIESLGTTVQMPKESQLRGFRDEARIAARTHPEPVDAVSDDMKLDGIHHITGMTHDVFTLTEFYRETLGLRIIKKSVNQDDPRTPHWFWGNYDGTRVAPHSSLTMFGWPTSNYMARTGVGQTHHVAFRADDLTQLDAWRDHLIAIGVDVTEVAQRQLYSSVFFQAPDGLLMEIATDN